MAHTEDTQGDGPVLKQMMPERDQRLARMPPYEAASQSRSPAQHYWPDTMVMGHPHRGGRLIQIRPRPCRRAAEFLYGTGPFTPPAFFSPRDFEVHLDLSRFANQLARMASAGSTESRPALRASRDGPDWVLAYLPARRAGPGFLCRFDGSPARNWVRYRTLHDGTTLAEANAPYGYEDGISFPVLFEATRYDFGDDEIIVSRRRLTHVWSEFIHPVSAAGFGHEAMRAENGPQRPDTSTSEVRICHSGRWLSIDDRNAAYFAGQRQQEARTALYWAAGATRVAVLLLVVLIVAGPRVRALSHSNPPG